MNRTTLPARPKAAPAKALAELSNVTTLMWIGVALLIHVVIFGATSVNYISVWVNGKPSEEASVEATAEVAAPKVPASAPAPAKTTAAAATASSKTADLSDEAKMLEAHKSSSVVKSITETAKPSELPTAPSRSGLDLDGLDGK